MIGILYASKNNVGAASTTFPIFAHEIPKEVGVIGILIHSNFTPM